MNISKYPDNVPEYEYFRHYPYIIRSVRTNYRQIPQLYFQFNTSLDYLNLIRAQNKVKN
uniref:Uncharacterized protein n=1 Tax=Rhizophagus irregularis (strain DAOM 181602 / DAOM 197198 / MUCL 43194) TaxID=747089 RepID=U9U1H8_RHIID